MNPKSACWFFALSLALASALAQDPAPPTTPPPLPANEPPTPTAPPAAPDPAAMPAEEVDCTAFDVDESKMAKDDRKLLKEVCAKAPRKSPPPAEEPAPVVIPAVPERY